ncbi:MAG: hypothetical protein RL701_151, partial [Pseudomonadota bacterium]
MLGGWRRLAAVGGGSNRFAAVYGSAARRYFARPRFLAVLGALIAFTAFAAFFDFGTGFATGAAFTALVLPAFTAFTAFFTAVRTALVALRTAPLSASAFLAAPFLGLRTVVDSADGRSCR